MKTPINPNLKFILNHTLRNFSSRFKRSQKQTNTTIPKSESLSQQSSNIESSKPKSDKIFDLFINESSLYYYKINAFFLLSYSIFALVCNYHKEFPDHLKRTMRNFGLMSFSAFSFLWAFSNRHVRYVGLNKSSKILKIETFRFFGLSPKPYYLHSKTDLQRMIPLHKKFYLKSTGLYLLEVNDRNFRIFNYFIIRPTKLIDEDEFNQIFKKLVTR